MIFNSWSYLLLLLLAVPIYHLLSRQAKWVFVCAVSYGFYAMWRWDFALLMVFSAVVDYVAANQIHRKTEKSQRLPWLMVSLVINLGLLIFFKYTYFLEGNLEWLYEAAGGQYTSLTERAVTIILPLGISFYTFQTISYTIDVYRGFITPEKNFTIFLAYVTFWPQLIAGPVLRAVEVIPQLKEGRKASTDDIRWGLTKVVQGLFKKVVLADNIAPLVDDIYAISPEYLNGTDVWLAAILFGFQIYYDFSGYSDIAIGSARLLGFHFPENFNWPYISKSPREFWRRWHISLSSWIRDYLYLPLLGQKVQDTSQGGLDVTRQGKTRNPHLVLFLTWLIMGFWHGAGWNFALWGVYHALFIFLYRVVKPLQKLPKKVPALALGLTFGISMLGWIPFRARTLDATLTMLGTVLNPLSYGWGEHQVPFQTYAYTALLVAGMGLAYAAKRGLQRWGQRVWLTDGIKWAGVVVLTFLVIVYLQTVVQFIYFQF